MALKVGDTIGDYQVVGVLGHGGMGNVFRVRNLLSEREEAMKVVAPGLVSDPDTADRFLREIKVQASLDHPNIAGLRTAFRVDDQILMLMELVEGTTLEELIRKTPPTLQASISIIDQVLSALAYAHGRGVIHRDIKPANILVTQSGLSKLTDFGIARTSQDRSLTRPGTALGSLFYMSPEQFGTGPLDQRSDLYSLGITLYEAVTGMRPIQGDSDYAIMVAHMTQAPRPPIELVPGFPPHLSAVVLRSLAKSPMERFQSAHEFQAALRSAVAAITNPGVAAVPYALPAEMRTAAMTMTPPPRPRETSQVDLHRVEQRLASKIGPIAKNLVTRAAQQYGTIEEICEAVAQHLPDQGERDAFLQACLPGTGSGKKPGSGSHPAAVTPSRGIPAPIDDRTLDMARKALAPYLGPIAKIMVDKTAKRVSGAEQLFNELAAAIPAEKDRKAFLAAVHRG